MREREREREEIGGVWRGTKAIKTRLFSPLNTRAGIGPSSFRLSAAKKSFFSPVKKKQEAGSRLNKVESVLNLRKSFFIANASFVP